MTSRKIAGIRRRQLSEGALVKTDARMPDSIRIKTTTATKVPTMRTGADPAGIWVAPIMASSSAARGSR